MFSVLTPRETEVMMLRIQVFKYREIADQLKISDKTVAKLLARALRKLQLKIEGQSKPSRRSFNVEEMEKIRQPLR
jgi:DNA-binding CsgD family transcriptional regulator